jgi:SAM-dependent methyltransferase
VRRLGILAGAAGATLGGALYARRHPSACPYAQRWVLLPPRPGLSRDRLLEALDPRPGERMLELGPGTGHYTLPVARALAPAGSLAIFDLQQEMLDHTMRTADEQGVRNLEPQQGDATRLPYDDAAFDAAFLVTVLGEIPDEDAALAELARVVKPGGRLVFGETLLFDPHVVSLGAMRERAERAGLAFERRLGTPIAFFARFARS